MRGEGCWARNERRGMEGVGCRTPAQRQGRQSKAAGETPALRRAGFKPRHKRMLLGPSTACADSPAQFPPCGVDVRAHQVFEPFWGGGA
jgi:hypothetical protein